ncbi:hypothetical protein [Anaerocolumna jejuensis]|uniref:hypothetical protein n=1 Tax=Anaerocolumna jejuensis TaxID=259063 RepID=UPI001114E616|nr:hypothetical protein [Anaerocolumna jejuensis]
MKELKIPLLNVNDRDSPFYVIVKWEDRERIVQDLSDTVYHEETVFKRCWKVFCSPASKV